MIFFMFDECGETCLTGILWDVWELRDEEQRFLGLKRCEKLFQFGLWVKKIQNSEIKNSEHRIKKNAFYA